MDIGHRLHYYFCRLNLTIHSWIEDCGKWIVAMRSIILLHCKNVGSGTMISESVESVPVGPLRFYVMQLDVLFLVSRNEFYTDASYAFSGCFQNDLPH